jgi:hypothetical protein
VSARAAEPVGGLASRLRYQAGHCDHLGSALYGFLLEQAATDVEAGGPVAQLLQGHENDPANSMLALRMMGAVHRRILEGHHLELGRHYRDRDLSEATWRAFQRVIAADAEPLRRFLDHPVQTNEVGRCAALLPGFLAIAAATGMPLRLLEVGASAGLNLCWDRYRYEADGFAWGDPASPVRLGFHLEGPRPQPVEVEVSARRGCDRRPINPRSEEGRLTVLSYVWPDQAERLARLRGALAASDEVSVEQAGAAEWIAAQLAERVAGVATVVFHSVVIQYLDEEERERFVGQLRTAGEGADETAPLAWLRMEPGGKQAEVRLALWPGGQDLLLGRAGYHGDPVTLLAAE